MNEFTTSTLAGGRYFDPTFGLPAVKIHPGEYYVTTRPTVLVTVVGACVAVCLRDAVKGIGGVTSCLVPPAGEAGDGAPLDRFAWRAMEVLIEHLLKLGARRPHLRAMVFGGGGLADEGTPEQWAGASSAFVRGYLQGEHIVLDRYEAPDEYPRKVYYFPATGKVLVRKLRDTHVVSLVQREARYLKRLRKQVSETGVELFE